jgi:hypothetical protein
MSRAECPNPQPDCKYSPECFADTDHIVPRRLSKGASALIKLYINHPVNKQQLCRRLHDEKTRSGDEPLPPEQEMFGAIESHDSYLSVNHQQILDRYRSSRERNQPI